MADHVDFFDDLLRGGGKCAQYVYREDYEENAEAATKRFYHEAGIGMWPTFTLPGSTIICALKSQLRQHALRLAQEAAAERAAKKAKVAAGRPKRRRGTRPSSSKAA